MAVVTPTMTRRGNNVSPGKGDGYTVKWMCRTHEVGSTDSATSTFTVGRIPSNARICGISRIFSDDLASAGSPTLDIGLFAVDGNITSDADALNDGIDVFTAAAVNNVIKDVANFGKQAWEFVSGQTTDPGGLLEVKISLLDAAVNVGGTVTIELYYAID